MVNRTKSAVTLVFASLLAGVFLARAQDTQTRYEIGIVYYAREGGFAALEKDIEQQSGHSDYSARVKGAHATIRLPANQPQLFRVCSVDPSRFKLFRFKSEENARTVTIAKINIWIGGSKTVLPQSEVPMAVKTADGGCFTLSPQETLGDGEYGFSPDGSYNVFMFGVGDLKPSK
jgi:hypothetical protein